MSEDRVEYGNIFRVTVPGNPQALKRHRSYRHGNHLRMVDPSQTDKMDFLARCMNKRPSKPLTCPLEVHIIFLFPRPKNHFRTGKFSGILKDNAPKWHVSRPDVDNLIKFVLDALNGVYWKDDTQVCIVTAVKQYDELPRVEMLVKEIF